MDIAQKANLALLLTEKHSRDVHLTGTQTCARQMTILYLLNCSFWARSFCFLNKLNQTLLSAQTRFVNRYFFCNICHVCVATCIAFVAAVIAIPRLETHTKAQVGNERQQVLLAV